MYARKGKGQSGKHDDNAKRQAHQSVRLHIIEIRRKAPITKDCDGRVGDRKSGKSEFHEALWPLSSTAFSIPTEFDLLHSPGMSFLANSTSSLESLESTVRIGQSVIRGESRWRRYASFSFMLQVIRWSIDSTSNSPLPYAASIHIIDNDSLLNIFSLYQPPILDGDEDDNLRILGGRAWVRDRWWYKLAQVCRRWRNLIFQSPVHLGLCLLCTCGTPVAEMLARSPPLPLVIDYSFKDWEVTIEEEEAIILALIQRNRVRRVRLQMAVPNMQKLIMAIDEEYPILEHLIIVPSAEDESTALSLPRTFQAPHLRHLALKGLFLQ